MKKPLLYPVVFMTAVTAVFISVLAAFNQVTANTVKFNNENELRHKILYVFDILPERDDPKESEEIFNNRIAEKNFGNITGYAFMDGNEEKAYAIPISGPGLWGSITGYLGLNKDFTRIIGIEFITQTETPGLGGRISEDDYKKQYRSIDITSPVNGNYIISRPGKGGNVDAISGATQTSAAVVKFINEDLAEFFKTVEVSNQ
ncbi:MAG: FMN-binding protein [Sedimentibacter sp.]|uniref:FMN-binding protein n=1 Tax=Sedimentibacter sp. TaxID=1960295 RepID=UPI003159679C